MLPMIISYGVYAGLLVGVPSFAVAVALNDHPPERYGMVIGFATMLLALTIVFAGVKRHRDRDSGGVIGFLPALGLGISLVATLFYVLAWEAALLVTGMDFAGDCARYSIDRARAGGASAAELARLSAEIAQFKVQYADPLYRLPMTFTEMVPVGVLVLLVCAALLRNPRFLPARG